MLHTGPFFNGDSRANRLESYKIVRSDDPWSDKQWLYLYGPGEVAKQIELAYSGAVKRIQVPAEARPHWTDCFEMPLGAPQGLGDLLPLLNGVLTLTSISNLEFCIALDWYKAPEEDVPSAQWSNTEIGDFVHRGKYYKRSPWRQIPATRELVRRMSDFVTRHPVFAKTQYIVSIPGHEANGSSFGELLAKRVAQTTGKQLLQTISLSGPRPQAKEGGSSGMDGNFLLPSTVCDQVIILDDVLRSGGSMRATATAAREAGANRVYGFVAVRTMRK